MKYPTKNGPGVPLQFGGKVDVWHLRLGFERFVTTQSTAAEAPANPAHCKVPMLKKSGGNGDGGERDGLCVTT